MIIISVACPHTTTLLFVIICLAGDRLGPLRHSFVDPDDTAVKIASINFLDGFIGSLLIHRYKTKSTGTSRDGIVREIAVMDSSKFFKQLSQGVRSSVKRKVTNVKLLPLVVYLKIHQ